ncbi:MAG TPA: ABC transporter permease [Bryobacteraceae bacterium]|nr:ABC transporter permease [Bryobacteraceae bacterium]
MEFLLQDIRYALRVLRRSPGFLLVSVLALALGIGATTAIFSVVDAVVLKPLPYRDSGQLVQLWMRFTGIGIPNDENWVSAPEFQDLQQNRSFSRIAAIGGASFNINIGGVPERIEAGVVSAAFFPLLGIQAQLGRVFLPEEGRPGREHVVLLSDGLWRRRFGADPGVIGRTLILNGQSNQVVGVLPPGFDMPHDAEVWMPLVFKPADLTPDNRGSHGLRVIARIRSGLTIAQARDDMAAVSRRIVEQNPNYPYKRYNFTVIVVPLLEQQIGDIRLALWVLMGAVSLVLLIACGNVANLLLARASARQREIAVRQALGVGRWRLARQLLTESVLLSLAGGAAGLLLAFGALRLLIAASATSFPRVAETRMDPGVLLFTLLVSLATGILFGLAPVFQASRQDTHDTLKEGGRGGAGGHSQRLRSALVVGELALSLALLAGSGLLIRSFLRLQEVDAGFRADGVLTMRVSLPEEKYPTPEKTRAFYRELLSHVRQLPGVDAAGAVTGLPLSGTGWSGTTTIDTPAVPPSQTTPEADQRPVMPGYFEAMGIPLLRGRYFDQRDNETAAPVAIVDETLARTYWPHQDAVGQRIKQGGRQSSAPWRTIVGVVRHVRYRTLESPSRVEFYWPYAQTSFTLGGMSLAIHTQSDPLLLANAVQHQVAALDPDQPVYRIRTMRELMDESMARRRFSMWLLAIFAGVALLLAAVGIYGVMSYAVARRAHEMGIRMALGARGANIVWLVLGQSLLLTGAGLAIGLVGSLLLTRLLATLLFDVRASDPLTYAIVAAFLAAVALLASFLPAWRATNIDPVRALREE